MANLFESVEQKFSKSDPDLSARIDSCLDDLSPEELRICAKFGLLCLARSYFSVFKALSRTLSMYGMGGKTDGCV